MPLVFEEYKQQANEKKMQYEEALKVKISLEQIFLSNLTRHLLMRASFK